MWKKMPTQFKNWTVCIWKGTFKEDLSDLFHGYVFFQTNRMYSDCKTTRQNTYKTTRAQLHRAAKHKNLFSMKFLPWKKTGLPTKFPFVAYCLLLYLAVVCLSWKPRGNFDGNLVFIKEETSCLANCCAWQLYEIGSSSGWVWWHIGYSTSRHPMFQYKIFPLKTLLVIVKDLSSHSSLASMK